MDFFVSQHIPMNRMQSFAHFQCLWINKMEYGIRICVWMCVDFEKIHLPMIALLLAFNCRSFGILNTTDGRFKNKLCEMSKRNNVVRSASSSGSLFIWLLDKFKSTIRKRARVWLLAIVGYSQLLATRPQMNVLPVSRLNLTENLAGIFLITFELRSQVFNSVWRIKW